jgi:TatD DNase family protein
VLIDAHFHADDLYNLDPGFPEAYREAEMLGLASVHDRAGLAATRRIMAGAGRYLVSFGIHPQMAIMDEADELERRAVSGELAAIGECGFDFYGDTPVCVRNPDTERTQRAVFEFQLELALRHNLPLVLHMRRAQDLLFAYARPLARLPAVLLHSWPGPANEALDFLSRCPRALFSFGNTVVNGNKKARSSVAALPLSAIVTETDAPYQPPLGMPLLGAQGNRRPLARAYSTMLDLPSIVAEIAAIRDQAPEAVESSIERNFRGAFRDAVQ